MDGIGIALKTLLQSESLEVPFFQRPYVWGNEHFEALIDSLDDSDDGVMPFFGSVILKEVGGYDSDQYLVIDGQQRCTTFSLLIRAILDVCETNSYLSLTQKNNLVNCIYKVEEDTDGNELYNAILQPSNPDKKSFDKVMGVESGRPITINENSSDAIEKAYKYFYEYFLSNTDKIKPFYKRINSGNKSMIKITLSINDDEQKIFDSVNSMGKSLSNADIIKNYIFQKLRENAKQDDVKKNQITALYSQYWDSVFYADDKKDFWYNELTVGRLKTDNLESFLKDFAIVKRFYFAKKPPVHMVCAMHIKYISISLMTMN